MKSFSIKSFQKFSIQKVKTSSNKPLNAHSVNS